MKGDFSRFTFKPEKHYSGVLMQQGRVQLDSDWNEQRAIQEHLRETEVRDTVGRTGAPETHAGFNISLAPAGDLNISTGRMYVDGILVENESATTYSTQPYLPNAPAIAALLNAQHATFGLAYLDVWRRHITALEDASMRETALGGPDTTTRTQTVWQVRVAPILPGDSAAGYGYGAPYLVDPDFDEADPPVRCSLGNAAWGRIETQTPRSLSARLQPVQPAANACEILPESGYQRLENQLYRVEVHTPGDLGAATFKWSRENGSVVTSWISQDGLNLKVASTGRDAALGFAAGDWVELTDDTHELTGQPGTLVRIAQVQSDVLVMQSSAAFDIATFPVNPKIRRWDHQTDTSSVPLAVSNSNNGFLPLEGGVEILFAGGGFQTGDYWLIPARTAIAATQAGGIEWPNDASGNPLPRAPEGIRHYAARLAIIGFDASKQLQVLSDCRHIFAPLTTAVIRGASVRSIQLVDGYPLFNGALATAAELAAGIRVQCAAPIAPLALRTSVFCFVTLYVPFQFQVTVGNVTSGPIVAQALTQQAIPPIQPDPSASVVAYNPLLLSFSINPDPSDPAAFTWIPSPNTAQFLQTANAFFKLATLPGRFTLKPGLLGLAIPSRDPFDAESVPELDFFFVVAAQRPAYSYLEMMELRNLQPVSLAGIGAHLL